MRRGKKRLGEEALLCSELRRLRLEAGLRQEDLAKQLDFPQSFVSKYENGERQLSLLDVRHICSALGVSFVDFISNFEAHLKSDK